MKSVKYLEQIREKFSLKNDAALAEKLGMSRGAISLYMSGKRVMDEDTCLRVALMLEMDNPALVLMAAGIDRAEKNGQKSLWEVFSQRMAAPASVVLATLFATNFLSPSTAEAASRLAPQQDKDTRVCVM